MDAIGSRAAQLKADPAKADWAGLGQRACCRREALSAGVGPRRSGMNGPATAILVPETHIPGVRK
jgi:hypothetical protein